MVNLYKNPTKKLKGKISPPNFAISHVVELNNIGYLYISSYGKVIADDLKLKICLITKASDTLLALGLLNLLLLLVIFTIVTFNLPNLFGVLMISIAFFLVTMPILLIEYNRMKSGVKKLSNILLYNLQQMDYENFHYIDR